MSQPRVVLVDLGRQNALGARRRLESWRALWEHAGAQVSVVELVAACAPRARDHVVQVPAAVVRRDRALESALWSRSLLERVLAAARPDVVVFSTLRSFHPTAAPAGAAVVLDLVDRLSDNYRQRACLARQPLKRALLEVCARRMAVLEQQPTPDVVRTAAGRVEAGLLDAHWVPNLVQAPGRMRGRRPDADLLYLGTLDYEPNVQAVRVLARSWSRLQARRPGTTLLLAGARPTPEVLRLAAEAGWQLAADFRSLADVCQRARVAVAPVETATGIQNKVLETAAYGLAQVVHPRVLRGVGEDFPALVASDDEALVGALVTLLDSADTAARLGSAAHRFVRTRFSAAAHVDFCRAVLDRTAPGGGGVSALQGSGSWSCRLRAAATAQEVDVWQR